MALIRAVDGNRVSSSAAIAICIEQTLGHRTHGQNLERAVAERGVDADVLRVEYSPSPRIFPVPWAVSGSRLAYRAIRSSTTPYKVVFVHTQTIGLMAGRAAPGAKYVVSVDATPAQLDTLGRWYQHRRHPGLIERGKRHWYSRVLQRADSVVAWSDWAKSSLVEDYGVDGKRVVVAHPGAPDELFSIERAPQSQEKPRILFVGGDFERKGGIHLLEAFRTLARYAELTIMTEAHIAEEPGVSVLHGVRPGTAEFREAWEAADIFCLPTLGDCTPVALGEAMAAGLPVVTTTVGSNRETVVAGTGLLVEPGRTSALHDALRTLVTNREQRQEMGASARAHAREHLSARTNANRLIDHLVDLSR